MIDQQTPDSADRRRRFERRFWITSDTVCYHPGCGRTFPVPKRRKGDVTEKPHEISGVEGHAPSGAESRNHFRSGDEAQTFGRHAHCRKDDPSGVSRPQSAPGFKCVDGLCKEWCGQFYGCSPHRRTDDLRPESELGAHNVKIVSTAPRRLRVGDIVRLNGDGDIDDVGGSSNRLATVSRIEVVPHAPQTNGGTK